MSFCRVCAMHGVRTPIEDVNQRNLKIWANVADKISFGRTWKFGSRSGFSAVQWRWFLHRASVVRDSYHRYIPPRTWWHLFHKSRGPQKWKINLDWSNQYCDSLYHWVRNLQEVKLEHQEQILQGNLLKSIDNKTVKRLKFRRLQPLSSIFSVTHFL